MAKKGTESPFQAMEEAALHAYREWPIWLVLRLRELHGHLDNVTAPAAVMGSKTKPRRTDDETGAR